MENAGLLINLLFALAAAVLGASLAARLGQSVVLGYILAGIVISPFTPGVVGDIPAVQALADIGVIFLMFGIGLQLSFRDLLRVGRIAIVGGNIQVLITIGLGYAAGLALGWEPMEALFLGAVVSNSSSTVLTKVLGERGEVDSPQGRIGLAWSSVQDTGTIVLIVILSALAVGSDMLVHDLAVALGKAVTFLVLAVPIGVLILPRLFERVADLRNREIFLLVVATVALGTAYISSFFGLSLALGAFVAGVVVGESDLSHQILGEVVPLRDLFAGLFFVSVGMLIDPLLVLRHAPLVLAVVALIVPMKGTLSAIIAAVAGYPLRTAVLTGVTLAQSAEFSFLLARVGLDVGVLSLDLFSVILAGSAFSIVLSPLAHRVASPFAAWLEARRPPSPLIAPPGLVESAELASRAHAVICGYGRVGQVIGAALQRRDFRYVVIDQDQRVVRALRALKIPALLGNAAHPVLLDQANLSAARVLVVAIPDPLAARQIVDHARRLSPQMDIIVRVHSESERSYMYRRGVREVVMGELELALEMARHTLHRFGVSSTEIQALINGLRERVRFEPEGTSPTELPSYRGLQRD